MTSGHQLTGLLLVMSFCISGVRAEPVTAPSPMVPDRTFWQTQRVMPEGLLNRMLAPGPLMIGHSQLEHTQCLKCHALQKGVPDSHCTECHKEIGAQLVSKSGFHGLASKRCVACHKEHRGREHDSTKVDARTFDHKLTGYALEGKHAAIKCSECHLEKRGAAKKAIRPDDLRFFGLTSRCAGCHKKNDVHQFTGPFAEKDCSSCHGLKSWKNELRFDHGKSSGGFALSGKHAQLACAKCHLTPEKKPIYKWPELATKKCLSCHEDPHRDNLSAKFQGGDCARCHGDREWKIKDFNHAATGFPLRGKHAALKCAACHKQTPAVQALSSSQRIKAFKWTGLKKDCLSCHQDTHGFGDLSSSRLPNPGDCLKCHQETGWKTDVKFDHAHQSSYPLRGKHETLACTKCHVPRPGEAPPSRGKLPLRVYRWKQLQEKNCEACHKSPHLQTFSPETISKSCTTCHVETAWNTMIPGFKHDETTRFPLKGRHRELQCQLCHGIKPRQTYRFAHPEKGFCQDCHRNPHIGQFSKTAADKRCDECHTQTDFVNRLEFNHSNTAFPLTGKHLKTNCAKCHPSSREFMEPYRSKAFGDQTPRRPKSRFLYPEYAAKNFCNSCHKNPHLTQFHPQFSAQACSACHTTENFAKRLPFDHGSTAFALRGKHAAPLKCEKCHVPTAIVFEATPSVPSHPQAKFVFAELPTKSCAVCHKDPHKDTFGPKCHECHNEEIWKKTKDFHKNFTLSGVHFSLECNECHKEGRQLEGMSGNCMLCHQKDDIHHGALPACNNCHRQQFWENPEFKHSMSRFPLRGIHRTLDCNACHRNGIYKGTPNRCSDCHMQDARRAAALGVIPHAVDPSLATDNCFRCHNQFAFH